MLKYLANVSRSAQKTQGFLALERNEKTGIERRTQGSPS